LPPSSRQDHPFDLRAGEALIVQKDAFMCAEKTVDLDLSFRKRLGTGLFGGEGFIMQKITGPGLAFLEVDGEVVEYQLQAGQQLKVDTVTWRPWSRLSILT